jgi:anti-sigma B factor antagonist
MEFAEATSPDVKIVRLSGPMTFHNLSSFQEFIHEQPFPKVVIVDLSNVPYIDSAALGTLVSMHVAREGTDRKYAFVGANERLQNLFDLAYVREFLTVFDSVEEAKTRLV